MSEQGKHIVEHLGPQVESTDQNKGWETWIYGFHMKNRFLKDKAEELGRTVGPNGGAFEVIADVVAAVENVCKRSLASEVVARQGKESAVILGLVVAKLPVSEKERNRIVIEQVKAEEVEALRTALGYPDTVEAKWYGSEDKDGRNAEGSGDDMGIEEVMHALKKRN